jgi:hypothetical protein
VVNYEALKGPITSQRVFANSLIAIRSWISSPQIIVPFWVVLSAFGTRSSVHIRVCQFLSHAVEIGPTHALATRTWEKSSLFDSLECMGYTSSKHMHLFSLPLASVQGHETSILCKCVVHGKETSSPANPQNIFVHSMLLVIQTLPNTIAWALSFRTRMHSQLGLLKHKGRT